MISKQTIDAVYEVTRVEDVIGDFVQLKRAGSNFKGLSPFSDERTPSFMVSPVKQIWKDFSSGKGGNAIAFIMEHEHFTYPEAIRYLAKKYNIEIEETETTPEQKATEDLRESLYLVSEFAQRYFHDILLHSEDGKAIGYSYFKERGFTHETIKKFGLGYSPETWDAFSKEALGKGYQLEFLEATGLTINKDGRLTDRFRGRVMFPIQSMSGRVLGFGGRILGNDKKVAKYLNSPESELYHKSKVLYGIFHAKQAIAKQDNCYLVEGYTDVIQFHQAGVENVVASSGTALTPDQIRLVNRLTKNITVLFDGDAAGLRASIRGIDLILEEGMNVKVCTFPDGEDPDSFAKKSSFEQLQKYLQENSKDFIQFKASLLMDEARHDPVKKADLIRDMVSSISKVRDRIQREIYIQETSRIMDISEQVLLSTLAQMAQKEITEIGRNLKQEQQRAFDVVKTEQPQEKVEVFKLLQREIIKILLLYGNTTEEFQDVLLKANDEGEIVHHIEQKLYKVAHRIYLSLQEDEVEFADEVFKNLYQDLVTKFLQEEPFEPNDYFKELNPEFASEVTDILMTEERYALHNWESRQIVVKLKEQTIAQYVSETIVSLREYLINKLIADAVNNYTAEQDLEDLKSTVNDYGKLKATVTNEIGRIRSTYL